MNTTTTTYEYTERDRADLAMTVVLVSFTMLFASLFLMYMVYRVTNSVWPPMGYDKIPLTIPTISTILLLLSSFTLREAHRKYLARKNFAPMFFTTLLLGIVFLVSQAFLWRYLDATGVYVESGIFASILHAFTCIHAGHVVIAFLALLFCLPALRSKNEKRDYSIRFSNTSKFWHFLGIVWILMFLGLFIF